MMNAKHQQKTCIIFVQFNHNFFSILENMNNNIYSDLFTLLTVFTQ